MNYLEAYIDDVSTSGLVLIKFKNEMVTSLTSKDLDASVLYIEMLPGSTSDIN